MLWTLSQVPNAADDMGLPDLSVTAMAASPPLPQSVGRPYYRRGQNLSLTTWRSPYSYFASLLRPSLLLAPPCYRRRVSVARRDG